jgi:hypothetical protein
MGVISTKESLIKCEKLSVSAFCRSPPPSPSLLPSMFVFLCRMLHSIGHLTWVQVLFLDYILLFILVTACMVIVEQSRKQYDICSSVYLAYSIIAGGDLQQLW